VAVAGTIELGTIDVDLGLGMPFVPGQAVVAVASTVASDHLAGMVACQGVVAGSGNLVQTEDNLAEADNLAQDDLVEADNLAQDNLDL